jgi:hypothetical protein
MKKKAAPAPIVHSPEGKFDAEAFVIRLEQELLVAVEQINTYGTEYFRSMSPPAVQAPARRARTLTRSVAASAQSPTASSRQLSAGRRAS